MNNEQISNLQAVRAYAALNVVLFHIMGTSKSYGFTVDRLEFLGAMDPHGVDIFFVMSGFIMVYIQHRRNLRPVAFLLERYTRISPIYYLLTIVVLVISLATPGLMRSKPESIQHAAKSLIFASQAIDGTMPTLYVGWSIEYEVFFYLIFAIGITIRNEINSSLVVASVIAIFVLFFSFKSIAFEFVFGLVLGNIYIMTGKQLRYPLACLIFGVSLLLFVSYLKSAEMYVFNERVVSHGLPAVLIIYGALGMKQIKPGFVTLIGDASYSIYLVQVLSIPGFYKLVNNLNISDKLSNDVLAIFCLSATAISGVIIFIALEKRLTKCIRRAVIGRGSTARQNVTVG